MTRWAAGAWSAAVVLALAAVLPAVWWEPLHVDEWVTLTIAPRSPGAIAHEIFVRRGGGPVHFFIEHWLLRWPGGVEGLRLLSVVACAAALPAAGLLARALSGARESLLTPALLALSPLAVGLASFGRMYALLLAAFLWLTVASVRAAAARGQAALLAASAGLGALVYVHPLAPLYAAPALAGALIVARARARAALWSAAVFFAVGLPYWAYSLWRLRERYYVGYAGSERLETTAGRSVPEESLLSLGAGAWAGAALFAALAAAGAIALRRRGRTREAAVLAAWVLIPIVFFTLVPAGNVAAGGTSFYARYLLPELPAFLILVAAGCFAFPRLVAVALAAVVIGLETTDDWNRLRRLHELGLRDAVATVRSLGDDAILLPAIGRPGRGHGRPAALLDEFVALEAPAARRFGAGVRVRIVAGPPAFLDAAARDLPPSSVAVRVSPRLLLVRSRQPR